jgi:hypothetical protein
VDSEEVRLITRFAETLHAHQVSMETRTTFISAGMLRNRLPL